MSFSVNPSTQYPCSAEANPTACRALFVKGLAKGATERHLLSVFSSFGPVTNCQIARHRSGRSAGFAIITFAKPDDAMMAMQAVDNQVFLGRRMCIRWFQPNRTENQLGQADSDGAPNFDTDHIFSIATFLGSGIGAEQAESKPESNSQATWSNTVSSWLNNYPEQDHISTGLTQEDAPTNPSTSMPLTHNTLKMTTDNVFADKMDKPDLANSPSPKSKGSLDEPFNFSLIDSNSEVGGNTSQGSKESSPTDIKRSRLATKWGVLTIPELTVQPQSPCSTCSSNSGTCSTASSSCADALSAKSSHTSPEESNTFQVGLADLLSEFSSSKQTNWTPSSNDSNAAPPNWSLWGAPALGPSSAFSTSVAPYGFSSKSSSDSFSSKCSPLTGSGSDSLSSSIGASFNSNSGELNGLNTNASNGMDALKIGSTSGNVVAPVSQYRSFGFSSSGSDGFGAFGASAPPPPFMASSGSGITPSQSYGSQMNAAPLPLVNGDAVAAFSAQQQYANALVMMAEAQKQLIAAAASFNYSGMPPSHISSFFPAQPPSAPMMYSCMAHPQ